MVYPETGQLEEKIHKNLLEQDPYEPSLKYLRRIGDALLKVEKSAKTESVIGFQVIVLDQQTTHSYVVRVNNLNKPFFFKL